MDDNPQPSEIAGPLEIAEVTSLATHALRRSVLRSGGRSSEVVWEGDDEPSTFHLAVLVGGRPVAVSTWLARPHTAIGARSAMQLRGMATDPQWRGRGVGATLLTAGLDRSRRAGVEIVWARARMVAVAFYIRHGFVTHGEPYTDPTTDLAHIDIVRRV